MPLRGLFEGRILIINRMCHNKLNATKEKRQSGEKERFLKPEARIATLRGKL